MAYSYFDLSEVVEQFDLTLEERGFFKDDRLPPSDFFNKALERNLNWAIAVDTEQARREGLTREILMELREQCDRSISVFSGREFNVDLERGLSGYCDFLISLSPIQTVITQPVAVIVEPKKNDLGAGLGQCAAVMVGAQLFNNRKGIMHRAIYGAVSTGITWRFLKLEGSTLVLDIDEYSLLPPDRILGFLKQAVSN
jgi:hypothetical protein